ncbi:glutathione S-transferase family protein [Oryzibacter oryziterrae]|uniref:glutathione S-transferase family protein n=1 Tax=Oryzibacter oryziterrae TaxID=2766474 RepID=UPI0028BE5B91|nr:glutathione S-transferase family protein [Oryzibacter oryziterrae]
MPNMILRSSPASPFGRKVKLAMILLGLTDQVTVEFADTRNPEDSLRSQNPLGKIPALILADGTILFDSRVISEYFDHLAGGGKIIPADPDRRFKALTLQAIGDGIMDAGILRRYEAAVREPEFFSRTWDDHQQGKIDRALAVLDANLPSEDRIEVGEISVACALEYLDFRFPGLWRDRHPKLTAWLDRFEARCPGFSDTKPK